MWPHARPEGSRAVHRAEPLILIVDDEEDLCRILSVAFEGAGYAVQAAHDGLDGLEKARRLRPAAILLDIRLPRLNGYQVLTRLQQDAALAATPVIMITILDEAAQYSPEEWTRRLGVQGFLQKPFEADHAIEVVRHALGGRGDAAD